MSLWHRWRWRVDAYLIETAHAPAVELRLRAHLKRCASCCAHYDEGVALLRAARGDLSLAGAGELARMVRRAGALSTEAAPPWSWRPALATAVAVCAVLLLLVLVPGRRSVGTVVHAGARTLVDGSVCTAGCNVQDGDLVAAIEDLNKRISLIILYFRELF